METIGCSSQARLHEQNLDRQLKRSNRWQSQTIAAKESVHLSLLMESLLYGLPKGETGSFPIHLASDSEAALSISKMTGLLRPVRHLELRHCYLPELVQIERLVFHMHSIRTLKPQA